MNLTNRIFNIRIALFAVLLIAVGYLSPPANAEEDEWKLFLNEDPYIWDGYTVRCFLEDGDFMWIGTGQGVVFKVFKETLEAVDTIYSGAVDMTYDKEGNIWFVGGIGLRKLVGDTLIGWDKNNYQEIGLPGYSISNISIDSTGKFWLAVSGFGLVEFDGQTCKLYDDTNAPFKRIHPFGVTILSTVVDKNNNIWVTAVGVEGVLKYDHKEWTLIDSTNSQIESVSFEGLAIDNNNNIWAGSSIGLYKYDGNNWVLFNSTNSEIKGKVRIMTFDNENNLWCTIDGGGLINYDGNNWQVFNQSNSPIFGNYVGRIYIDRKQNIWFRVSYVPEPGEQKKGQGVNIYRKGGVILVVVDEYRFDSMTLIYPNPSDNIITISNIDSFEYYDIFDIRGLKVMSGMLSSNSINISELTTGSYSILLRNNTVSKSSFFIKY